jgi:hypothetical protein
LPSLTQHNSLRDGVIAAGEYCNAVRISCDFMLQPMLLTRKKWNGPEIRLARALNQVYPRYDQVILTMYRTTANAGLRIQDGSALFDQTNEPYFFDAAHINEAGNRVVAERIAATVAANFR